MTEVAAAELLEAIFTDGERHFLLAHPKFKTALGRATEECIFELADFGLRILHHDGYVPRASTSNR